MANLAKSILYGIFGVISLAYLAEYLLAWNDDPKEPTRLRSKIPLIGHLIGIITSGPSYHSVIRSDETTEIYTLGILNFKLYTSVSTRLLPLIQRQSRALSFRPMIQTVARKWGDANDETDKLFGETNLTTDFSHAMKTSLAPGTQLDEMNLRMAQRALIDLDLLLGNGKDKKIKLLDWARHAITQASSCGVYGNQHPFLDPEVYKAFWTWHAHLSAHISGIDFDLRRLGYRARQVVFDAHAKYCSSLPPDTSSLFLSRWSTLLSAGLTVPEATKQQATLPIGMLSNTVPTFFWTIYEIYSRPSLLTQIREEILANAVTTLPPNGSCFELDVSALKTECPLLLSTFQETQRTRHIHAAIRKVMTDTLLDDKYLLKRGNYLQMPGHAIHSSTKIWGPTAKEFNPHRFTDPKLKRSGADFLAWGAPPHLCPARQFAAVEILILIGLLVVRADISPVATQWEQHPELDFNDPVTVLNPKRDVDVEITVRNGWEGIGKWKVKMGGSKTRVGLASG
ncbi:cytochrome P450 [Triangularia setosa]|uniref:Cytochrome P450 n=1 Tax=Triangularia setosa TaxID=2587417 RepID=A0AAN6VZ69_9PEZI|nr:cytochrome P450 [Podospora setosa]